METKHSVYFRQNLETVETVSRKQPVEDQQQCPPEDHHCQKILRFYGHKIKHLSQPASTGQPPEKKSKKNPVNGEINDSVDYDNVGSDNEDAEEFSNQCTRKAYLSEFVKFLQTKDAGSMTKKEASAHAHQVLSVMEEMDDDSDTIHCLLDRKEVSEWKQPLDEKRRSTRILLKYLSSLEKFYIFLGSQHLSPRLARSLDQNVPQWSKKVQKLAHNRFGERMVEDAATKMPVTQTTKRGDSASTVQPPEKRSEENADNDNGVNKDGSETIRERAAWNSKNKELILRHFTTNPGKAAIRQKLSAVKELQELMNSETFDRVYEKVKSLYRKKRVIMRNKMQQRSPWRKDDVILLLTHFKNNPGKANIRRKLFEVEELRELMNRESLTRVYEKVKGFYKKKK